ncbi:MAG: tetratricopeptide repeat protein [Pseudomonadota bacterium]|nr:tetratricopeptide repeat protein [Pseudomonadota bacterium]
MSELLREIEEEIRRERLLAVWKKYHTLIIGTVLAVVVGTAGVAGWHEWRDSRNSRATAELSALVLQAPADPAQSAQALASFAQNAPASQAMLARLHEAGALAKAGKTTEAIQIWDTVSADRSVDAPWRDLATLLSVMHQADSGDPVALLKRLEPLTGADSSWRFSAREWAAVLKARSGNRAEAAQMLHALASDPQTPASLRERATDLALAYEGAAP